MQTRTRECLAAVVVVLAAVVLLIGRACMRLRGPTSVVCMHVCRCVRLEDASHTRTHTHTHLCSRVLVWRVSCDLLDLFNELPWLGARALASD